VSYFLYDGLEGLAARDDAAVQIRGPQSGVAAVNKESSRCGAVRDDALCARTKHTMRHLFVRGHPAAGVLFPAELRERRVKPSREGGQHHVHVEVSDWLLGRLR
jgi:hypothetical protein